MSNFKLLMKIFERNKFQKYFIIAATAAFTGFEAYVFIAGITEGFTDSLFILSDTLRTLYFLNILFIFFSYECFSKINSYSESISVCKKSLLSVHKTELLLFCCYIFFLTAEAILINIIYIAANSQFSFALIFHTATRLLCYFTLCLLTAVFIGLALSHIKKKYIAYAVTVVFAVSEIKIFETASMYIFESTGKDLSKFFEFFLLAPHSLDWMPNEQTGVTLEVNKISILLFYTVFSVLIYIAVNGKSIKKAACKGTVCAVLCLCLLSGYFIPVSSPKMDLSASGICHDDLYYLYNEDCQKEEEADFRVEKYDLRFSAFLNLRAEAEIYVSNKSLPEYKFTLYHKYRVFRVTDQNGTPLDFRQESDYLTIRGNNNETECLHIEYCGGSAQYYSSLSGILLPANFAYYPIPGFHKMFDNLYGFFDNSPEYDTVFNVEFDYPKTVYCNLDKTGKNRFSGSSESITLLSGYYKTEVIDGCEILYPYFSLTYRPEELNEAFGSFIAGNRNIRKILIIPYMSLPYDSGMRVYDDYLFTNQKYDIEQRAFESKIDISKKDFYNTVCDYYDPNTDAEYLARTEQEADNDRKMMISVLKKLFASENREKAAEEITEYLIDGSDMRTPSEFLKELEEKYA